MGGLGPWVSALPMGPMDVFENYIFEISLKNWKNEPEENFLEGFFKLTVSKKRGALTYQIMSVSFIYNDLFAMCS